MRKMRQSFLQGVALLLTVLLSPICAWATDYHLATTGDDANAGTLEAPFHTLRKGISVLKPGDTLYVKNGTYKGIIEYGAFRSGTSWEQPVKVAAYPGHRPVIIPPGDGEACLYFVDTKYFVLDGFVLDSAPNGQGIGITWGTGFPQAHHIELRNCEIKNSKGQGILTGGDGCRFISLDVHDNGTDGLTHGIYLNGDRNLIDGGKYYRNVGWGIHVYPKATNTTVRNVRCFENGATGLGLVWGSNNVAYNNVVYRNGSGIHLSGDSPRCYNNTVYGNRGEGLSVANADNGPRGTRKANVRNNIVFKNESEISDYATGTGTVLSNNFTRDPNFIDAEAGDFRLRDGSPAIDRGTDLSMQGVTVDIEGKPRPQGKAFDIGAFEHQGKKEGVVYHVAPDGVDEAGRGSRGAPFKTIGYAVKVGLKAGDIVAVRRGRYDEQVTIKGLSGTADAPITLKAVDGPRTATVFWQNPDNVAFKTWPTGPAVFQIDGCKHVVIDGFVVSGGVDRSHGTTWAAAGLRNSSFCTVQNCVLQNAYMGWEPYPRDGGVADGNKCLNNVIRDNGYVAMIQSGSTSFAGYGVYVGSGANRNIVDGCEIYDNCAYGLQVKGEDNIVRNCRIYNNGRGTLDPNGRPYYSNGNYSPSGGGITLNDGAGGLVHNNLIYNNAGWGIAIVGYLRAVIMNNTIFNNNFVDTKGCGISSSYSSADSRHVVRNNILFDNRGGELVAGYNGTLEAYAVANHNYVDDATRLGLAHGPTHTGTIQSSRSPFLSSDPLSPDFLKPDPKASPSVVDAGADLSALFSTDFAGLARPAGGAWDIGAFEYQGEDKSGANYLAADDNSSTRGTSEARCANLPSGNPPEPVGRVINVATFGVDLADNDADDTKAVSAAIASAGDNCTLYFPKGIYNVRWVRKIEKMNGLSIKGHGPTESILKRMGPFWHEGFSQTYENLRASYATDCKILRIEDCRNMCIRDIGFDANGTPTFGGVGIKKPKRLNITNTRYVDSGEQPALFGKDRYAWCILGYEEGGRDIWFTGNVVEGLQVEMDGVDGVVVERNILKRSVKSPGIGFLSGNFSNRAKFARGYSNTNVTIRNNYFTNSRNLSMGMVTFQLDPATNCHSVFRNIDILDNVFVYDIDSENGHAAIKLGAADSSLPTKGNVFENFRIEGNKIYRKPDVDVVEQFGAYIWYNCWAGEHRLNRSVIRNNVLYTDNETKPLLGIGRKNQSADLIVENNDVRPYQPPPSEPRHAKITG